MKIVIYEFKARLGDARRVRAALKELRAQFVGEDHQVDTYFRVPAGRLKIREGKIENSLIFYRRRNAARARPSKVELAQIPPGNSIRAALAAALGVLAVVDKRREIYFVGNVKIHLDRVRGLGRFVEVEAISRDGRVSKVRRQAREFQKHFGIVSADIVPLSYSDLILKN